MRTVERRGKSLIPWSRMEIELSRSCSEDFKDCTEAESEFALDEFMFATIWDGSRNVDLVLATNWMVDCWVAQ